MSFKGAFEPPCNYCGGNHSVLLCQHTPKHDDDDDSDDATDLDPHKTPIITGDDPDEVIPDELGGES